MPKSNAANVIDLDAFRQRRQQQERAAMEVDAAPATSAFSTQPVFVPVWFCWVPAWSPIVG